MDPDLNKLTTATDIKTDRIFVTIFQTAKLANQPFQGFAKSVSSIDRAGAFDILPNHENFVTWFEGQISVLPLEGDKQSFKGFGVIEVANNIVRIFLHND